MAPAADAHDDSRPADVASGACVYRLRRAHRSDVLIKAYRHTLEAVDERTGRVDASCDVFGGGLGVALAIREGSIEDRAPAGEDGDAPAVEQGDTSGAGQHTAPGAGQDGATLAEANGAPADIPDGGPGDTPLGRFGGPRPWRLEPNGRYAPTRWTLHDPDGRVIVSFEGEALARRANPLGRAALSVYDAEDRELFRLIDPRSGVADRTFGIGPDAWALVDGPHLVASLGSLPTQEPQDASRPGLLGRLGALLARPDRGLVSLGGGHVLPAPAVLCMVMLLDELTDASAGA